MRHHHEMNSPQNICAVVLAAGQSKRMGQPKLVLPWGETTVIGQVISSLSQAGIQDIYLVTGGAGELVKQALAGNSVRFIENRNYQNLEMLASLQSGIEYIEKKFEALLVVLGDQPSIDAQVIRDVIDTYLTYGSRLVVPSYQYHRGHPWLVHNSFWPEISNLAASKTLRDFLNTHSDEIHYVSVDNPAILYDLDTPEDYLKYRPHQANGNTA